PAPGRRRPGPQPRADRRDDRRPDRARLGPRRRGWRSRRGGRAPRRADPRFGPARYTHTKGAGARLGRGADDERGGAARDRPLWRSLRHRRAAPHGRRAARRDARAEGRLMPAKRTKNGDGLADFAGTVPHFFGHRARLRQRLIAGGWEARPDYEVLEVLLFAGNPRGDTKPLAKDLLQRFGCLADVLRADSDDLLSVPVLGDAGVAALKSVREAALRLSRAELSERPLIGSWDKLID